MPQTQQSLKKPLRIAELVLLVVSVAIGSGAYMLSGLGMDQTLDAHYWIQLGVMLALAIIFHIVLRLRAPFADQYIDRKSTRLNSIHVAISYAVFCLKKKKRQHELN